MTPVSQMFSLFGQGFKQGYYYIEPYVFSTSRTDLPENLFPRDRSIEQLTCNEMKLLRQIFQRADSFYPGMSLDEQCFFAADYIIPDIFPSKFDQCANIPVEQCQQWFKIAEEKQLIENNVYQALSSHIEKYVDEVKQERQWREFYPAYKAIIKAWVADHNNENILQHYLSIPQAHKIKIEAEIADEQIVSMRKILLMTWFTFLQSGLCQVRLTFPGNPNHPISPEQINWAETYSTVMGLFSFVPGQLNECFQVLDRMLPALMMFPLASAESRQEQNQYFKIAPEFIRGTTSYNKTETDILHQAVKIIDKKLNPFLSLNARGKVILLGENHDQSMYFNLMVLHYVSQWQQAHKMSSEKTLYLNEGQMSSKYQVQALEYKKYVLQTNRHNPGFKRDDLTKVMRQFCMDGLKNQDYKANIAAMVLCKLSMAQALGFDTGVANNYVKAKQDELAILKKYTPSTSNLLYLLDVKLHEIFPTELHLPSMLERSDKKLIDSLSSQSKKYDLTILAVGAGHLKPIAHALEQKNTPYKIFNLERDHFLMTSFKQDMNVENSCLKYIKNCPQDLQSSLVEFERNHPHKTTACLLDKPYNAKECDTVIHQAQKEVNSRVSFYQSDASVTKFFAILPNKIPKSFSQLFLPKKSVDYMKQAFEKSDQQDDVANEQRRVEL